MKNTVTFTNKGLIDLRAVRTFGVSAKECDNPIGFFGTGLKYAIAICLRLGCKVELYRGLEKYTFGTAEVSMRNADFRVVTMNGEELGFTTDLGKKWEPWQAFREIYCNTIDEGGEAIPGEHGAIEDHTTIVVSGEPFYAAYVERDRIVLNATPSWAESRVHVYEKDGHHAYYRGIRVAQLQQHALLTYNVLANLDLTEDRTIKNQWSFDSAVRDAILTSENAVLIAKVLQAPEGSYESRLDFDCWTTPSEAFLKTLEGLGFRGCTNNSALKVFKKHRKCEMAPDGKPLNVIEQKQLDKATEFCEWMGYTIRDYEIVVTADLGDNVWGRAYEGKIYINRSAFQAGTKIVAGTLIEEYIHLRHRLDDESRELQNHLLNALVSVGERAMGEPI